MLRITERSESGNRIRLRLDGTLSAESYKEFAAILATHKRVDGRKIKLDLAGVTFMNDESARNIAMMPSEQLRIINCSPFIEALLSTFEKGDGVETKSKATDLVEKQ